MPIPYPYQWFAAVFAAISIKVTVVGEPYHPHKIKTQIDRIDHFEFDVGSH
jgi:hypothetical protein